MHNIAGMITEHFLKDNKIHVYWNVCRRFHRSDGTWLGLRDSGWSWNEARSSAQRRVKNERDQESGWRLIYMCGKTLMGSKER